jgi:hypothetical protein
MLIERVYQVDPLTPPRPPRCGGVMKIIAFIEAHQGDVLQRILRHTGLWNPPPPRPPPRPPPPPPALRPPSRSGDGIRAAGPPRRHRPSVMARSRLSTPILSSIFTGKRRRSRFSCRGTKRAGRLSLV